MPRPKYDLMTVLSKAAVILIFGFGAAWTVLLIVPPPAAATRLGFAARIAWPVAHLLLTSVLALAGGLMLRTVRGSALPQSKRSRKMGWICCLVTLILSLVYVGSIVVLTRDHGKPPSNSAESARQVERGT